MFVCFCLQSYETLFILQPLSVNFFEKDTKAESRKLRPTNVGAVSHLFINVNQWTYPHDSTPAIRYSWQYRFTVIAISWHCEVAIIMYYQCNTSVTSCLYFCSVNGGHDHIPPWHRSMDISPWSRMLYIQLSGRLIPFYMSSRLLLCKGTYFNF